MKKLVDLSILIVNHNGVSLLDNCLASIYSQVASDFSFEVIVSDNDSHDNSDQMVAEKYPQVIWLPTGGDRGYGYAHNQSARNASGRIFYLAANDIKFPLDFFARLSQVTHRLDFEGLVIINQKNYDGTVEIRAGFGLDIFGFPCLAPGVFDQFFSDGSSILVDRQSYEKLGGFDADLYLFYEDIDLFWRARIFGLKVQSFPQLFVYHKGGATVGGGHHRGESQYVTTTLRRYLNERNAIRNMIKNYSWPFLTLILPTYFLLSLVEMSLLFLVNRRFSILKCYLSAWFWNWQHRQSSFDCRRKVQSQRQVSDGELWRLMYHGYGKYLTFKKIGLPLVR